MTSYYTDQLEITWYQVIGMQGTESEIGVSVTHSENYIWSSNYIIRNAPLTVGYVAGLILNWAEQYVVDSTSWNEDTHDATCSWLSPVIDLGYGWKPDGIILHYDDRDDYQYVTTIKKIRASDEPPALNDLGDSWVNGEHVLIGDPFDELAWNILPDNEVTDLTARFVQVMIEFVTTDPVFRFPIFRACHLSKTWFVSDLWGLPSDAEKFTLGDFDNTETTDFYGITLSSNSEGIWTSPLHDFGDYYRPGIIKWSSCIPTGTYLDTIVGGGGTIQARGSDIQPIGGWSQDQMPDPDDPAWGIGGSLEDAWLDVREGQLIIDVIGVFRYAQFRFKLGING
jgi:hypothetical protein